MLRLSAEMLEEVDRYAADLEVRLRTSVSRNEAICRLIADALPKPGRGSR